MSTTTITTFAKLQVKPGELGTVLGLIARLAPQSRAEKGNLFYNIYQSTSDPQVIVLAEAYADDAALAEHRASAHFQEIVIGKIVPLLDNREIVLTTELALDDV
ncbi:antibiotic biosynthesis monooxygenase [Dyadobacter beijingensis]|uniref:Antibiotic biosynthesis monooxygenase n=1 Tax=Dyadobacter beijingensis TaxID=365489 RepID=A0ABQ2IHX7_9BACT|nr:putative quinol monooxygenase [Dyadobacter beijingensis]GGN12271.1 antibiotic biosynthesis monooxygenase [Dyadobacter beijingensis]